MVNADESEPGTCKDREIMRKEPHKLEAADRWLCQVLVHISTFAENFSMGDDIGGGHP